MSNAVTPLRLGDPLWLSISASLRRDPNGVPSLYVKLPGTTLWGIISEIRFILSKVVIDHGSDPDLGTLPKLLGFLRQEYTASMASSIFLRWPVVEVERDLFSLEAVRGLGERGYIEAFITALEAGLRNDPGVDWITRCGGPACNVLEETRTPPHDGGETPGLPE